MVQPTPADIASPKVLDLLQRLHILSETQERSYSQSFFYLSRLTRYYIFGETWNAASDDHMRDKFVALKPEKYEFVYLLAKAIGATRIVKAGTSFGVSTIYLALAVGQNILRTGKSAEEPAHVGKVIATEKEPTKAAKAKEHWKEAGDEVEPFIELREGDLLETLKVEEGMPEQVDMLLLDSRIAHDSKNLWCKEQTIRKYSVWTPLALTTLKIIKPRIREGAVVIADNVIMGKPLYKEFFEYIKNSENGFRTLTIPYNGGLEVSIYSP